MPSLSPDVEALGPELVALRRDLHAHPELAFAEHAHGGAGGGVPGGSGLEIRTGVGGTGVLATRAPGRGRTVLLRVDMDALPIQEQSARPLRLAGPRA